MRKIFVFAAVAAFAFLFMAGFAAATIQATSWPSPTPRIADGCWLDPSRVDGLTAGDEQTFIATCYDKSNNQISCPTLSWFTSPEVTITQHPTNEQITIRVDQELQIGGVEAQWSGIYCAADLFGTNPMPGASKGTRHLYNIQGIVKDKLGVAKEDATIKFEIRYAGCLTGGATCSYPQTTPLYEETFTAATDENGRFNVVLGESKPLNLNVNDVYYLRAWVGGEEVLFDGNVRVRFQAFAGPGSYDHLSGPLSIASDFGPVLSVTTGSDSLVTLWVSGGKTALKVKNANSAYAAAGIYGDLKVTNNAWVNENVFAKHFIGSETGVDLEKYATSWAANNKRTFSQPFAGTATITAGQPSTTVLLPPFDEPLCQIGETKILDFYVTLAARQGNPEESVYVSNKNSATKRFTITTEYLGGGMPPAINRNYDYIGIASYTCSPNNRYVLPPAIAIS